MIFFTFFCLIIRACFQSKVFQIMTSDQRHPSPSTIQDLIDRRYSFYSSYYDKDFEFLETEYNISVIETRLEMFIRLYETQAENASAKVALEVTDAYHNYATEKLGRKFDNWMQLKNFVLATSHGGFGMLFNSFYFDMIDETVNSLIESGIMKLIYESYIKQTVKKKISRVMCKVIGFEDLQIYFIMWSGFCCVSILCFIIEVLMRRESKSHTEELLVTET
ncbi:hypothetical protein ACKWTF_016912 [Chironomus riparius]